MKISFTIGYTLSTFLMLILLCFASQDAFSQKKKKPKGVMVEPAIYKVDSDKDGVPDVRDQCPGTPPKQVVDNFGCPTDKDMDTIYDYEDKCIDVPGPKENFGCPWGDKDNDGFTDNIDRCPDIPGIAQYQGCPTPDRDRDGIDDKQDKCPDLPGLKEYGGCPDRDKDGVIDPEDACPDVPGLKENKGCPKLINEDEEKTLKEASKVQFASGKWDILPVSYPILNKVVTIMKKYPKAFLNMEGHTDSDGDDNANQILSENRASAVRDYLATKGVGYERITSRGLGESKPIDSNDNPKGKYNNRRVAMTVTMAPQK
jgi:OmpA-OmpF porin, OOP family